MKLEFIVSQSGDGDFQTITEAVNAVPYSMPARILVKSGVYREKLFVEKHALEIVGEGAENTVLSYADAAYHPHPDGRQYGTFRSYTAFLGGEHILVKNMTVENTAGDGNTAGQAIAAYVDAKRAYFENVRFLGFQDTLFTAPLPPTPRIPGSFIGPRGKTPRNSSMQYYENCFIRGDIDFIFGGADAVFQNCKIFSNDRGEEVNGYIAAPCTPEDGIGYLFLDCCLCSDAMPGTVYLGRPWREHAKAAYLGCEMGAHIAPAGWDNWDNPQNEKTTRFAEYNSTGPGAGNTRAFGAQLTEQEAAEYRRLAEQLRCSVLSTASEVNSEENVTNDLEAW